MTWLALGLVVALVLAWSTHADHSTASTAGVRKGASRPAAPPLHARGAAVGPTKSPTNAAMVLDPLGGLTIDRWSVAPRRAAHSPAAVRATTPTTSAPAAITSTTVPASTLPASTVPATTVPPSTLVPATPARAASPSGRTDELAGTLSFPSDVATTYFEKGAGGALVVSGTWATGRPLVLSLTCGGLHREASGRGGTSVEDPATHADCSVVIAEPAGATWSATYHLTVRALAGGGQ